MARSGGGSLQRMSTDLAAKCQFSCLIEIVVPFTSVVR